MNDAIKEAERVISENESYLSFLEREGRGYEIDDLLQASQVLLAHAKSLEAKVEDNAKTIKALADEVLEKAAKVQELEKAVSTTNLFYQNVVAERDALKKRLDGAVKARVWESSCTLPKLFITTLGGSNMHEWRRAGTPLLILPAEENNLQATPAPIYKT